MTKIFNFALKFRGVVGRVAEAKSSDSATPPKKKNLERALEVRIFSMSLVCQRSETCLVLMF